MKIWTVPCRGKVSSRTSIPKTPVIRKVGRFRFPAPTIGRGLYALADTWNGEDHAGTNELLYEGFAGSGQKNRKYCIAILAPRCRGEGFESAPIWMNLYCAAPFSKHLGHFPEGLVEFSISSSMPLIAPALGHPATVRAAGAKRVAPDHRE